MLRNTGGLRQNSTFKGTSGLNRGNSRLSTKTRIPARSGSSGRIIGGVRIWSLDEADKKIREFIFKRDGYKCVVTGDPDFLTPSHYHGRGNYAVRFDPDNLITLNLWTHTTWEPKAMKETEYKDFMIKFIGTERFNALNEKAKIDMKKETAIIHCMKFLGALVVNEK